MVAHLKNRYQILKLFPVLKNLEEHAINKDLNKGNIITEEDLITLRPNIGIDATKYFEILGKRLERKVKKGEPLDWNYFEND